MGGVEDLGQVAEALLHEQHSVGLGEFGPVFPAGGFHGERLVVSRRSYLAESFKLIQESLADALAFTRVKVVLVVGSLDQLGAEHHNIFKQKELGTPSKLLELSKWSSWRGTCSQWNPLATKL